MTTEDVPQREPSDAEIQAAGSALEELSREAAALGDGKDAARLHYAMGRVYSDRLGDLRSAAVCYQNAFQLDPEHRPTLEAARQLFLAARRPARGRRCWRSKATPRGRPAGSIGRWISLPTTRPCWPRPSRRSAAT